MFRHSWPNWTREDRDRRAAARHGAAESGGRFDVQGRGGLPKDEREAARLKLAADRGSARGLPCHCWSGITGKRFNAAAAAALKSRCVTCVARIVSAWPAE
jgi:hypothetical protein